MCGRYVSPEEAAIEREWGSKSRVRIRNPLGDDGSVVESCAVITIPANAVMNVIDGTSVGNEDTNDGRMPAVPTREDQEVWLHGMVEEAFACLVPYSDELTIAYPVSLRVNSVKNNDAGLVEEVA